MADQVAILDRGRIVVCAPTEQLRHQIKQVIVPVAFYDKVRELNGKVQRLDIKQSGHEVALVVRNPAELVLMLKARGLPHRVVELNLDEIFEALIIGRPDTVVRTDASLDPVHAQQGVRP